MGRSAERHVTIDINDREFSVVARNAILPLLAFETLSHEEAGLTDFTGTR